MSTYYCNMYYIFKGDEVDIGKDFGDLEIYPHSQSFSVPYFIVSIRCCQISFFGTGLVKQPLSFLCSLCSILELFVFLYHVVNLKNTRCLEIDAYGPVPTCSVLIYNPRRRYEVGRSIKFLHE